MCVYICMYITAKNSVMNIPVEIFLFVYNYH